MSRSFGRFRKFLLNYAVSSYEQEVKRLEKEKHEKIDDLQMGIIICDVDGLKQVNDTLGHEKGDLLLLEAARIIRGVFAAKGLAARTQ